MDAVQEIKARLDVLDIVSEYLALKPAGTGSFKACCPFHHEKSPSFFVHRGRQSWHCFGCDMGGDLISFVQKMEGLEFPEALEHLAQKAGVELPQFQAHQTSERKRLYEVNDLAARFFRHAFLTRTDAEAARAYAASRGLDDLTMDVWRIGYAPTGWSNLVDALKQKGATDDEMMRAGLALRSEKGSVYDRFRDRLMFTICDVHGHVVGFTGRVLHPDAKEAKYVNTPETLVYKKSHVLFGLDKAKGEIRRKDQAVIVEGNMDVIGSHQFHVTQVVASSGTALTREQLVLIKRYTNRLAIAFDADAAGNAATIRGLDLARQEDMDVRIIVLPPEAGKDPDDAVRKNPELWKQAIHDAIPVVEWLYRGAFKGHEAQKPEGKKAIAAVLLPEFLRIPNPVERDAWMIRLAKDLGVSEQALRDAVVRRSEERQAYRIQTPQTLKASPVLPKEPRSVVQELEDRLRAILTLKPELQELAESILVQYAVPRSLSEQETHRIAMLADREFPEQSIEIMRKECEMATFRLRDAYRMERQLSLEEQMREAERTGDVSKIQELLHTFQSLHS